ncbi:MAG: asparaginase domain-containing protein [Rubricoccaceae bacterium]
MDLHILTTGGTIDKVYFDAKSTFQVGQPLVSEILDAAGVVLEYEVEVLFQKDSLELTDADRQLVIDRVQNSPAQRILITHGTDTMTETASAVSNALGADSDRTIVFVGSLTPARFKASDAEFNVGFAAAAAQILSPGVYVAMNGHVFDATSVRKNRTQNRFESMDAAVPSA